MKKGTPLLMQMLNSTENRVLRATLTAFSHLSIIEGYSILLLFLFNIFFLFLFFVCSYGAKELWGKQCLKLIVPFIKQEEDSHLMLAALTAIANICNHGDPDLKVLSFNVEHSSCKN